MVELDEKQSLILRRRKNDVLSDEQDDIRSSLPNKERKAPSLAVRGDH